MRSSFIRLFSVVTLTAAMAVSQSTQPAQQKPDLSSTKKTGNTKTATPGQVTPPANPDPAGADVTRQRPAPRFDVSNIDKSVDPCTDFYQYACGNWMKNNPIPADYPVWVSFAEVQEHNLAVLHQILEKASVNTAGRTPVQQKIGDFYASCMDESAVNAAGVKPLQPELDRIAAAKDKTQLIEVISHL